MANEFDAPQSANEAILQNMLGADNELREPQSRIETLLLMLLEQGGGGEKKYLHNIILSEFGTGAAYTSEINVLLVTTDSEKYTTGEDIRKILFSNYEGMICATGWVDSETNGDNCEVIEIGGTSTKLRIGYITQAERLKRQEEFTPAFLLAIDTVFEL